MSEPQKAAYSGKIPAKVKVGYGTGDIAGNLVFTIVGFYLQFYFINQCGLDPLLAGISIWIGRIFDAFTDPLMGYISDRTRTRWGRRRPYLLFGSVPLGLSCFILFTNPEITNQALLFFWATGVYMFLNIGFTIVNVTYSALTPDLTKDYHEVSSLNAYRMIFAACGTLIGAGAGGPIKDSFGAGNNGYMMMGAIFGIVMIVSTLIPFFSVKEPSLPPKPKKSPMFKSYKGAFKNRPYLLILIPWTMHITGVTVVMATVEFYFTDIFHAKEMLPLALGTLVISAMIFIPINVVIAKKIGKKNTYNLGMAIFLVVLVLYSLTGRYIGVNFSFVAMFLAGVGYSTHYVMPWTIMPDTIEYDYLKSGERKEGIYYGIWTFTIKIGQAFANLLVGIILKIFQYQPADITQPDAVIEQLPIAKTGIMITMGPIAAIFIIIGILVLRRFPINEQNYKEIEQEIKKREQDGTIGKLDYELK